MSTESAKKLFKADSEIEALFTDYSFHLYLKLKGKTLTESEFNELVVDVHCVLLSEVGANLLNIIINTALIIFALQIWENLTDQIAQEEFNSEYGSFKSVLKSQKSE